MFNFKGTPLKYGYAVIKTNKGIIKYTLKTPYIEADSLFFSHVIWSFDWNLANRKMKVLSLYIVYIENSVLFLEKYPW